jgi:atypical dual specificity phosphatase
MDELENFSYLIPGELAGMGYPHAPGALPGLRALGFRSLLSLSRRAPDVAAIGPLVHLHCPLADFARIPPVDLHRAVVFLDRAPRPIAVHGEGGVGRTGVVLACQLVAEGRSAAEAIAEVRRARPGSIDDEELEASISDYERFFPRSSRRACYNLATGSPLDRIAHGAERPGFGSPDTSDAPLEAWLGFMSRQGIREVVCLLDEGQVALHGAALLDRYRREFLRVTHIPLRDHGVPSPLSLEEAIDALRRAEAGAAPAVVHCAAGIGRTGVVLAGWLRARHGLRVEPAIEMVRSHARHFGALRDPLEAGDEVVPLLAGVKPLPGR